MSEDFTRLTNQDVEKLLESVIEYEKNDTPTKLRSSNMLYTFIDAYQVIYDSKMNNNQDPKFLKSALIALLTSIYYTIYHCILIFDGMTTTGSFVKFNSVNIEWVLNTPGLRGALEYMKVLLCFILFKLRSNSIIFGKIEILTLVPNDCINLLTMLDGLIPSVIIPDSGIPIIENIYELKRDSSRLIEGTPLLLLFFRTISKEYVSLIKSAHEVWALMKQLDDEMKREDDEREARENQQQQQLQQPQPQPQPIKLSDQKYNPIDESKLIELFESTKPANSFSFSFPFFFIYRFI